MITWMQRHKKWLIITIWISGLAFIASGPIFAVGSGSFKFDANNVAVVGDVEITKGELQKSYSNLYQRYAQIFQGNFDEEKAKQFGLQKQALQQLISQALVINLAKSYNLNITDQELYEQLKQDQNFFKNGVFDKEVYKQILSQNRMSIPEYEKELKKQLLIQKMFTLLKVETTKSETQIIDTILSISDKIEYKILSPKDISITPSDEELQAFWQTMQNSFMNEASYDVKYLKQTASNEAYDDDAIATFYEENKTHFKDSEGKILSLESAKNAVVAELNAIATKKAALRTFVDYKNGKVDGSNIEQITISSTNNPFNTEVLETVANTAMTKPFIKPIEVKGEYYIFELTKINPATPKTFAEAKKQVLPHFLAQKTQEKVLELANNSVGVFQGKHSDFLTMQSIKKIPELDQTEATEFLQQLFTSDKKRSFVTLQSGKIVLFNILEQKLLKTKSSDQADVMARLKNGIFSEGLMKTLQKRYNTEIFIEGL